ncbi:MAG: hypothetical protein ACREQ5_00905 [Candidatus Dormibacteria bacterium]
MRRTPATDPNDPDGLVSAADRRAKQTRRYQRAVTVDETLAGMVGRCTLFCGSPRAECTCAQARGGGRFR